MMDYRLQFDDNDNTMAALTRNVNKVYRVQRKGKKQQHTLTHMWKKELDYIFNAVLSTNHISNIMLYIFSVFNFVVT